MADTTITTGTSETCPRVCVGFEAVGASVQGPSHKITGEPCQDCFAIEVGQEWAVAVVSDGAGSAAKALDGARIVSAELCRALMDFLKDESQSKLFGNNLCSGIERVVIDGIERARRRCMEEADVGTTLHSYHATVVGTVVLTTGGVLFHLGDGGASAHRRTPDGLETIGFSAPENGEYINETFFFTQDCWREHLRVTEIPEPVDAVWLMTDGAYELMVPPQERKLRAMTAREIDRLVFEEEALQKPDVLSAIAKKPSLAG